MVHVEKRSIRVGDDNQHLYVTHILFDLFEKPVLIVADMAKDPIQIQPSFYEDNQLLPIDGEEKKTVIEYLNENPLDDFTHVIRIVL